MVTIRLTRRGAKNQPFYHVVVTDSRKRQGGAGLEQVGFSTRSRAARTCACSSISERIDHWRQHGAQESDRVRQLVASYRHERAKEPAQQAAA